MTRRTQNDAMRSVLNASAFVGVVALAALIFYSRELAANISNYDWAGLPKEWAVYLIVAFFAIEIALVNSRAFEGIRKDRDELAAVIIGAEKLRGWLLALGESRREGVKLRNSGPGIAITARDKWIADADDWAARSLAQIERLSPADAILFDTLDWFDAPDFAGLDDEHKMRVRITHAKLQVLRAIIMRYTPNAMPVMRDAR